MAKAPAKSAKMPREPVLEWVAAGLGLVLTLAIMVVIGREALNREPGQPPAIEAAALKVTAVPSGFVVEIEAVNRSGGNAAIVEIEGALMAGGNPVETSSLTFDYVPGHATRKGGLFFRKDPRAHRLELRALGYQAP